MGKQSSNGKYDLSILCTAVSSPGEDLSFYSKHIIMTRDEF